MEMSCENEEDTTQENLKDKSGELKETKSKNACTQCLGEESMFQRIMKWLISLWQKILNFFPHPFKRAECQKPVENTSEDLTDEVE